MKSESTLYCVVFGDGEEEDAEGETSLDAAKKASRKHARKKGTHVRVLRVTKQK